MSRPCVYSHPPSVQLLKAYGDYLSHFSTLAANWSSDFFSRFPTNPHFQPPDISPELMDKLVHLSKKSQGKLDLVYEVLEVIVKLRHQGVGDAEAKKLKTEDMWHAISYFKINRMLCFLRHEKKTYEANRPRSMKRRRSDLDDLPASPTPPAKRTRTAARVQQGPTPPLKDPKMRFPNRRRTG